MKPSFILTVFLFAFLSAKEDDDGRDCCEKKIVGGKTYMLAGKFTKEEAKEYYCSSPCLYTMEGDDEKKFCFKPGSQESKCAVRPDMGSSMGPGYSTSPGSRPPRPSSSDRPDMTTGMPGPTGGSGGSGGTGPSMNLELVSLSSYPLAKCNDGTTAVYYRQPNINSQETKKMLIYLRGGGLCVPGSASKSCDDRCSSEPSLCTASTDPDYILGESNLGDNIGSNKQNKNPAFWDYSKIYVPYCSSDLYSGTASASSETGNRIFHGKHIVKAVLEDLVANTWITQAEQVTLIGTSAGAVGVEFNCDLVAEELHKSTPSLDVKCVADSGTINPPQALAATCQPGIDMVREGVRIYQGELDQSCVAAAGNSNNCIFLADSYSHISTPFMVMTSAADTNTLLDICALEEPINNNFLQSWKTEVGQLGEAMGQARADVGIFFDNCPYHVAVVYEDAYKRHSVPTIDGGSGNKVLRDLLYNFIKQEKPYQGVDDMNTLNPNCSP